MSAQVLLLSPVTYTGVVSNTPSGTVYKAVPGTTITAQLADVPLLETFGFALAPVGTVLFSTTELTNAQLLSLFTSPVTILPPPGAGFAYIIISSVYLNKGTNGFTSSDNGPGLYYGVPSLHSKANVADGGSSANGFTSNQQIIQPAPISTSANQTPQTWADNAPIVLANATANMTGGVGSTGVINFLYYIVPLT
jgi:hypothetical protein